MTLKEFRKILAWFHKIEPEARIMFQVDGHVIETETAELHAVGVLRADSKFIAYDNFRPKFGSLRETVNNIINQYAETELHGFDIANAKAAILYHPMHQKEPTVWILEGDPIYVGRWDENAHCLKYSIIIPVRLLKTEKSE